MIQPEIKRSQQSGVAFHPGNYTIELLFSVRYHGRAPFYHVPWGCGGGKKALQASVFKKA
jgi:hypothetical protein